MELNYNFINALLVQLVERRFPKPDVEGSSPSGRVFKSIFILLVSGDIFNVSSVRRGG